MADKAKKKAKGKKKPTEQAPLQPTFKGHQGVVSCVEFFNETLYTGSWDKSCKAWDLKGEEEKGNFEGHTAGIQTVKFNGGMLWSASLDKSVRTWDMKTGECRDIIKFPGSCLAMDVDVNSFFVACEDVIYCVSIKTKEVEGELRGHANIVVCVKFHNNRVFSGSWDKTLRVWNPVNGECEKEFKGHTDYISAMFLQGHSMFSGSLDKTIRVWDVESNTCMQTIKCPDVPQCLAAEGTLLLAGLQDSTTVMWDTRTFEQLHVFVGHTDAVRALVLVDGRFFTGSKDKTAKRWDTKDSTTRKPEDENKPAEKEEEPSTDKDKKKPAGKK